MYLLFIYTVVVATISGGGTQFLEWRYQAEFNTETKCVQAAKKMQIPENKYICTAK